MREDKTESASLNTDITYHLYVFYILIYYALHLCIYFIKENERQDHIWQSNKYLMWSLNCSMFWLAHAHNNPYTV